MINFTHIKYGVLVAIIAILYGGLMGFGSLGYGLFWMLSGYMAPGMGSTGAAKESVGLIAQASGGAFFVSGLLLFSILIYRIFINKTLTEKN